MSFFDELFADDPPLYDPLDDELTAPRDPDDPWSATNPTPSQTAQLVDEYPAGVLGLMLFGSRPFRERAATVRAAGRDPAWPTARPRRMSLKG